MACGQGMAAFACGKPPFLPRSWLFHYRRKISSVKFSDERNKVARSAGGVANEKPRLIVLLCPSGALPLHPVQTDFYGRRDCRRRAAQTVTPVPAAFLCGGAARDALVSRFLGRGGFLQKAPAWYPHGTPTFPLYSSSPGRLRSRRSQLKNSLAFSALPRGQTRSAPHWRQ